MSVIYKRKNGAYYYRGFGQRFSLKTADKTKATKLQKEYDLRFSVEEAVHGIIRKTNNSILFKQVLEEYLSYKKRNFSINTYNTDRQRLQWVLDFTGNVPVRKFDVTLIEAFVEHCGEERGWQWSTTRIALVCWRAFINYCIRKDYLIRNPFKHFPLKKSGDKFDYLTIDEIELLKQYHHPRRPWVHPFLNIALLTGFRRGELCTMEWRNITPHTIIVNGKTGRREFPNSQRLNDVIQSIPRISKWLFPVPTNTKKHIDPDEASHIVKKVFRGLNFPEVYTLHTLRHSFASHLALNGVPIQRISILLGHKVIYTTMKYAHLMPKDVKVDLPY